MSGIAASKNPKTTATRSRVRLSTPASPMPIDAAKFEAPRLTATRNRPSTAGPVVGPPLGAFSEGDGHGKLRCWGTVVVHVVVLIGTTHESRRVPRERTD